MTRFKPTASPWGKAASLVELSVAQPAKADALLGEMTFHSAVERRRCQFLFYGVLRHRRRIDALLSRLISRRPKPRLQAMLQVAVYELLEAEASRQPKVVDHAVGQIRSAMSKAEAGLANAVLRKIPVEADRLETEAPAAVRLSHPDWLAEKWTQQFSPQAAEALMRWNLRTPEVTFRVRDPDAVNAAQAGGKFLEKTDWPGFMKLTGEFVQAEPLLQSGALYAQDPSTRLAVEALAVKPGETVLDLCAAPGGKTLMLADALGDDERGLLVAVDLPGPRLQQLDENLSKLNDEAGPGVYLLAADVRELTGRDAPTGRPPGDDSEVVPPRNDEASTWRGGLRPVQGRDTSPGHPRTARRSGPTQEREIAAPGIFAQHGLPDKYDAVLLDAPCSNTGVLRRRPDGKWRLGEEDIMDSAMLQLELLRHAATLAKPGGRLVYSTCSIEPEENLGVVEVFLNDCEEGQGFTATSQETFLPWETGHDGAGVTVLEAKS